VGGDVALLAIDHEPTQQSLDELSAVLQRRLKVARADAHQLTAMIERYYPPAAQAG
jgi:hypothetical protein